MSKGRATFGDVSPQPKGQGSPAILVSYDTNLLANLFKR